MKILMLRALWLMAALLSLPMAAAAAADDFLIFHKVKV